MAHTRLAPTLMLWFLGSTFCGFAQELHLSLEKESYAMHEDVFAVVTLRNMPRHTKEYYFYNHLEDDLGLEMIIYDGTNRRVEKYNTGWITYGGVPTTRLKPGDSALVFIPMLRFYANELDKEEPYPFSFSLSTGTYTMQAFYRNLSYDRTTETPIFSNKVNFRVVAIPDSEKQAFQMLRAGRQAFMEKSPDKAIRLLRQLVTAYPNSIYGPRAYRELATVHLFYDKDDIDKWKSYKIEIIERYPNTTFAMNELQLVFNDRSWTKEERQRLAALVSAKMRGTRVAEFLQNVVRKPQQ